MYFTYILKSINQKGAIYIGSSGNWETRLAQHNSASNKGYSKRHAPWQVESYFAFQKKVDAESFENYLKSSSGKAFMRKRLLSNEFKADLIAFKNNQGATIT